MVSSIHSIYSIPPEIIYHISGFLHYRDCAILGLTCTYLFSQIDYNEQYAKFVFDLEKVKLNGQNIKDIEYHTNEMCLLAVKQDSRSIIYVKKQNEEICFTAVKKDWRALKYAKKQTEEMCLLAVK
jgi:hypothetical protein